MGQLRTCGRTLADGGGRVAAAGARAGVSHRVLWSRLGRATSTEEPQAQAEEPPHRQPRDCRCQPHEQLPPGSAACGRGHRLHSVGEYPSGGAHRARRERHSVTGVARGRGGRRAAAGGRQGAGAAARADPTGGAAAVCRGDQVHLCAGAQAHRDLLRSVVQRRLPEALSRHRADGAGQPEGPPRTQGEERARAPHAAAHARRCQGPGIPSRQQHHPPRRQGAERARRRRLELQDRRLWHLHRPGPDPHNDLHWHSLVHGS
mmetsp:Transcript_17962/g.69564  ORF Transcript_17962/g.69564 Transcript_17962/m.69564 type:complete len:261 (+) Transcript_17962:271-1053(+)